MRRGKHDCSEASHLQGWNKLLTSSEIIILPQMTCWATCRLSQRELLILHVHHIRASVRLVRMEWLGCVFNEGRETPAYFRFSADSCHQSLLPDAGLQMAETFDHRCFEPHLWPSVIWKTRVQPVPAILAHLHIRVSGNVCSRPADYRGAALCASFTLHLSSESNCCSQLSALEF